MIQKPRGLFTRFFLWILKIVKSDHRGVALIVALLVMLVLVLLALSLILQSQTEYVGSINEKDSLEALSHAEAGLEWFGRKVKDYLSQPTTPPDFDDLLNGLDDGDTGDCGLPAPECDDNLIGFRTIDKNLSLVDLDSSNEKTTSVIYMFDWDNDGTTERYEAFRIGVDTGEDGDWDGPRAIVYIRIDDNYDEGTSPAVQNLDDLDYRIRVRVMADYPVFVNSDGEAQDPVLAQRGTARRRLEGKVAPQGGIAIRTDGDYRDNGHAKLCGECGGVHANEDIEINGSSPQYCYRATASGDYDANASPDIAGDTGGGYDEEFIPVINPYDDLYVPTVSEFDHSSDAELAIVPFDTQLQCGPPTASDPGNSKYFAFVFKKTSGQHLQVYKAYWDFAGTSGANRWLWRLIDSSDDSTGLGDTLLDNCGRLVSGIDPVTGTFFTADAGAGPAVTDDIDVAGGVSQCDGLVYAWPACQSVTCPDPSNPTQTIDSCEPDGILDANDGTNGSDDFYGFAGSGNYSTVTCTNEDGDETLMGLQDNDFTRQAFWLYPSPSPGNVNSDLDVPALPGTFAGDSERDFIYETAMEGNQAQWKIGGNFTFAPLYNAVLWFYGNANIRGDFTQLQYYDEDVPGVTFAGVPNGFWRTSIIAYGNANGGGNARVAPATGTTYQIGMVAGRDINLDGGFGYNDDSCPFVSGTEECPLPEPTPDGFQGVYVAHEQVGTGGNNNLRGYVIAEDADFCIPDNQDVEETIWGGNPSIYYDCENPPDLWLEESIRVQTWEEVQ